MNTQRRRIVIIQGHPDGQALHFCHALAEAYAGAALSSGHEVRRLEVASLGLPLLQSKQEWESAETSVQVHSAQDAIAWADHLVIVYPLWLGCMPAMLKGFFEQVARPGFAVAGPQDPAPWSKKLKGRSARIIVTMGMPGFIYRWYFGAHGLRSLQRNILGFVGIHPVRSSLVGSVEGSARHRTRWLERMRALGSRAG
ncbi:MAG TPA: NAD(P)H-dependent oxidoreductase [Solimonas sp.]|nr:NAD(P)H-dependent oxidoreductase [Solimonas sp.]